MSKIKPLDFRIDNIPHKQIGLAEAIMLVAEKLNEVISELNKDEVA